MPKCHLDIAYTYGVNNVFSQNLAFLFVVLYNVNGIANIIDYTVLDVNT